jgi:hypothetical protein
VVDNWRGRLAILLLRPSAIEGGVCRKERRARAQRLPEKDIFDAVNILLNARDSNGELCATESVLVSMADQWRIKTDAVRRVLAYQLATAP